MANDATGKPGAASVLTQAPDVVWRDVAGETVLLDTSENVLMGLNGTGGLMWSLLDGEHTLAAVARQVAADYEREYSDVLTDLLEFSEMLLGRGLLRSS